MIGNRMVKVNGIYCGPQGLVRVAPDGLLEGLTVITASLGAVVHWHKSGLHQDIGIICRMKVSTAFVNILAKAMDPTNTTEYALLKAYKYHQWGTSTTGEANTQLGCIAPADTVYRVANDNDFDIGTQVGGTVSYATVATLVAHGSVNITEHCVHPEASASNKGLDRSLFTAIPLSALDAVTWTYTLNIPAET